MKVVFWVDSRNERGGGHLSRSLSLAHSLITSGHEVSFVLQELSSFLDLKCVKKYFVATHEDCVRRIRLINDDSEIDWLVIDNYDVCDIDENKVRAFTRNILVIDDLANRTHNCDLLVDQNIETSVQDRYATLVPNGCKILTGLRYLLARPQFYENHDVVKDGTLIFLGGGDSTKDLISLLNVLTVIQPTERFKVLVTSTYNYTDLLPIEKCPNFQFYRDLADPSMLFRSVKRAIVRCGFVSYELALLGVPTLNIFSTEIQRKVGQQLGHVGYGTAIAQDQLYKERILMSNMRLLEQLAPIPLARSLRPGSFEITTEMESFCG